MGRISDLPPRERPEDRGWNGKAGFRRDRPGRRTGLGAGDQGLQFPAREPARHSRRHPPRFDRRLGAVQGNLLPRPRRRPPSPTSRPPTATLSTCGPSSACKASPSTTRRMTASPTSNGSSTAPGTPASPPSPTKPASSTSTAAKPTSGRSSPTTAPTTNSCETTNNAPKRRPPQRNQPRGGNSGRPRRLTVVTVLPVKNRYKCYCVTVILRPIAPSGAACL
jgi:hypothetical protein